MRKFSKSLSLINSCQVGKLIESSNFLSTRVKESKDSFVKFDKETDRVYFFIWQFFLDTNKFMLRKVLKMFMILTHGQATVGFSVNGKLLVENLHTESVIAQRHIHNHMQNYDLQAHDLDITYEFLDFVSSERKHHFQSQKERLLAKEKSSKDFQLAKLNEEISKLNIEVMLFKSTISDLQKSSGKTLLDAQKKKTFAEMRNEITKVNALIRAATEKYKEFDKTLAKKTCFIEKKYLF